MENKQNTNTQRPPVVVVMGHIDHGKSQLLDYIRKSSVVEGEAGGITQHIGAYEADVKCDSGEHSHKTQKITFLDTPGHEAFSKMRSRGAKIADIAILIIAANEGIKPQTIEAHKAIEEAGIPFIIALNKMDKPEANPEQVKAQLAEKQIFVENYGGKIPTVNISAKTGTGVDELLDMALLLSEMEDLTASPTENASGTVIESHLDAKRGITATLLIQNGSVQKGMFVASGQSIAPVRIFEDFQGNTLEEASFSSPIKIVGFDKIPEVGAEFKTFASKKDAEVATTTNWESGKTPGVEESLPAGQAGALADGKTPGVEENKEDQITIPVVIKADTAGSIEAIEKEIMKLEDEEAKILILRKGAGIISEDDLRLSFGADNPVILGFNVSVDSTAKDLAERFGASIQLSDIIYKLSEGLSDEIKKRKLLIPREEITGAADILKTFSKTKNKQVIGGKVTDGKIAVGKTVKIKRKDFAIGEGRIAQLQHNKADAKEVEVGKEFGAMIESKTEIARNDTIEIIKKTG